MSALRKINGTPFRPMVAAPITGRPAELAYIEIDKLCVDDKYQRSIDNKKSETLIRTIAAKFDWRKFELLIVVRTADGRYEIIDGQHRAHAAAALELETVPCAIIDAIASERAEIFSAVNTERLKMAPLDLFWARVAAGDARAVKAAKTAMAAGVTILRSNRARNRMLAGQTTACNDIEALCSSSPHARQVLSMLAGENAKSLILRRWIRALETACEKHPELREPEAVAAARNVDLVALDAEFPKSTGFNEERANRYRRAINLTPKPIVANAPSLMGSGRTRNAPLRLK